MEGPIHALPDTAVSPRFAFDVRPPPAYGGLITINESGTIARAGLNSVGQDDDDVDASTAIPTHEVLEADFSNSNGQATNTTTISFSEVAGETILRWDFDHFRSGNVGTGLGGSDGPEWFAYSTGGVIFTAATDKNTTYELSGEYKLHGDGGNILLSARLHDITLGTTNAPKLFDNVQSSFHTADQLFTLGGLAGDWDHSLAPGSELQGGLTPGNKYQLFFEYLIDSFDNDNTDGSFLRPTSASADGYIQLKISESTVAAVPEPTSMALLGLASVGGIGTIRARRSWRKQSAA